MINGNAKAFIEELFYQDHCAVFKNTKYYFNACQCKFDKNHKVVSAVLEIYNLSDHSLFFSAEYDNCSKCIEAFENAPIFNGKTFWQVEKDIEWVDC
jgi:hypothetical protein